MAVQEIIVTGTHPGIAPDAAFAVFDDLETHVVRTSVVRSVTVEPGDGPDHRISCWQVQYRKGLLKWSQHDHLDREARVLTFTRRDGDPAELSGTWAVDPEGDGSRVTFTCRFDLGVPTLSGTLDPLAGRILRETIVRQLQETWPGIAVAGAASGP
jgi:ribosome-associated toxin RatA of RatAB toxin-antitoxin module